MFAGFIGLGRIGTPMAQRLIDAVEQLIVFDIDPAAISPLVTAGARAAASVRDVADRADIVFLSLPSREAFEAVTLGDGGLSTAKRARLVVNTSTVGGPSTQRVAAELQDNGKTLIDCPISGGIRPACDGTLSVMVAGDAEAVAELVPLLAAWGKVTIAGRTPGAAQALKLANNILSIVALLATSEAFVMGAKAGLDPEIMLAAINAGTGRNSATTAKFPTSVLDRSFNFGAAITTLMKDADLALEQAAALGVPMPVCEAARDLIHRIDALGWGERDVTRVVQYIEDLAHFEIPKTR